MTNKPRRSVMDNVHDLDILIFGGGIAGLWLLDELRRSGHSALLLETQALGQGQTITSQGILHGGFKHAIGGRNRAYAKTLNAMPGIWRACFRDLREPRLSLVAMRGYSMYVWRTGSIGAIFGQVGARFGLHVEFTKVAGGSLPSVLNGCPGTTYRLEEQVVDPASLISWLASRNRARIIHAADIRFSVGASGRVEEVRFASADRTQSLRIRPNAVVFTAGEGNIALREACGLPTSGIRRIPLAILLVRGRLPILNGFCVDGIKAKAIVTSQEVGHDTIVWQVACEGIASDNPQFEDLAWRALSESLPGFDWPRVERSAYHANRVEYAANDTRSDGVQILEEGNAITAWPTKLVLAPRLAEEIVRRLPPPSGADAASLVPCWSRPSIATVPWGA